jgi:hypothetical protein
MFKFNFHERFPCSPRDIVMRTMYHFDEYEKFAPNVTRVEVLSREKLDDGREKVSVHVFAEGALPPIAKVFAKSNDMDWKEYYWVDLEKLVVDWKVETPMFTEYVDCKGTSCGREAPGGSEIVIPGDFVISPPRIPGIPTALVQAAIGAMEPFIGKMVTFNLKKYFENVRKHVEKENKAKK